LILPKTENIMKISPLNRYLILGGAVLSILGYFLSLGNFSDFADTVMQDPRSIFEGVTNKGAGFFKSHSFNMGIMYAGGTLSTIGIVRALIEKYGDGKVIDGALEKIGGTRNTTINNQNTHVETVHGPKIGNVSENSTVSIGAQASTSAANLKKTQLAADDLANHFRKLVAENKIEECLEALIEHFKTTSNANALGMGVLLLSKFKQNEQSENKGTEKREDVLVERSRISKAILDLINQEKRDLSSSA